MEVTEMKYVVMCLALFVQLGCSSVHITESDLSQIPFCNYRRVPDGISDRLELDEKGLAVNCPYIEEVETIADIRIMPYAPLHAKIVGLIIVKKGWSYEPYCRLIGSNLLVMRMNDLMNKKGYDIYDAYYS